MRGSDKYRANTGKRCSVMKRPFSLTVISAACLCAAAQLALPAHAEEAKQTGWKTEKGKRYYYDADGKKVTGDVKIDGVTYVFAPNGAQQLGWQTVDGKRYFVGNLLENDVEIIKLQIHGNDAAAVKPRGARRKGWEVFLFHPPCGHRNDGVPPAGGPTRSC